MPRRRRADSPMARVLSPVRAFLDTEAAGGIVLVGAAVVAVLWANSPVRDSYERLWSTHLAIGSGHHRLDFDLRHWVNDALMTLFFLVVGLEVKREMTSGHLSTRRAAALPVVAALGGMVVPAGLYLVIAGRAAAHGWGVPMATDIALAVGVLTLLANRVAAPQRAFLLGLAVVDDIGAIVVIAAVYSTGISWTWLFVGAIATAATIGLRMLPVHRLPLYVVCGAVLWFALHEAGIHPTIAGVVMGLLAPTARRGDAGNEVVERLERVLHPLTSFAIVPLFAIANAGIRITSTSLREAASSAVAWGVFAGLVAGKPLGVVLAARLSARTRVAELPQGTTPTQLLGIGNAAGIGFTVALFIAELAFTDPAQQADAKLAIFAASVVSAMLATAVLSATSAGSSAAPPAEPR